MNANDEKLKGILAKFAEEYTFEGYDLVSPETHGVCDDTPLHSAAAGNEVELLRDLMPYVTNIDVIGDIGLTPLAAAALHGNVDAVEYLLSCGADPFIKSEDGRSALDFMRANPEFERLVAVVEAGVSPGR